jgi:hypothetical protein
MAVSVYSWSQTAGTNATADANINWAEGQLPSTVNNSARAMMAALAAMVQDMGGGSTTGGSSNAYTLTCAQTMSARVPALVAFKANHTNTGAATLNVDSTGASALRGETGVALNAGDIVSGCIYVATWVSGSSEWLLVNASTVTYGRMASAAIASAANFQANTASKLLSANGVWSAGALTALTDAATIAVDLSAGINFSVTLGGNRTLGAPTNAKVGQAGSIWITQDGTGSRTLAYASAWKTAGGVAPVLTTTAAAVDRLDYVVRTTGPIVDYALSKAIA